MTESEILQRQAKVTSTIQQLLPDFAKACADDVDVIVMHQDAFAADYRESEYALLGMAIKYAGLCGKDVQIVAADRQTVGAQSKVL